MRNALFLAVTVASSALVLPATQAAWTTFYDADTNVLPVAPGQIFEGGSAPGGWSLTDLGAGDIVMEYDSQDTNTSNYMEKTVAQSPVTWNVNRATGFSVELNLRLDSQEATDSGGCDLIFGSPDRFTSLRFLRGAGDPQQMW